MSSTFFSFFEKLSDGAVDFTFAQKGDDQPVGQAHDLIPGIAEALFDAILIRAVGVGHGDLAVLDGNGIGAAVRGDGEFLIDPKIHDADHIALAADLGPGGRFIAGGKQHQHQAKDKNSADQDDPVFIFHSRPPQIKHDVILPVSV